MNARSTGPEVAAVVVGHASRTRLRETLRSLGAQTFRGLRVVVAAIGSLDVPEDKELPRSEVVRVPEGAGLPEAVRAALHSTGNTPYLLLLHDDVSLEPDAVEQLMRTATSDPAIVAVGAKLVEWDRSDVLQEVGAAIDRFAIRRSALDAGEVDHGQRDDTSDVLFCSDACLLLRRDAFDAIGGLDDGAWPFYEDVDLCWRLRSRGHRVVVAPQARARHAADLSRGRRLFDSITLRERAERGRLRFMFKHYALFGLLVLLPQIMAASLLRLGVAMVRRELWRVRVTLTSWTRVVGELPSLIAQRREAASPRVDDRELLRLASRSAVAGVRGERAEWASRLLAGVGRILERSVVVAREPVTWGAFAGAIVVILLLRNVILAGPFVLGEVRPLPSLSGALSDHLGRVRGEGLDPFGPPAPGLLVVAFVQSVVRRVALGEKMLLLLPLIFSGAAAHRLGRTLGLGRDGRRWLAAGAAVNPVTLSLLRDGSIGALAFWAGALWILGALLSPSPVGEGLPASLRFAARWSVGWAIVVALHPPAFLWLGGLGAVVVSARSDDNRTQARLSVLATGAVGSFVLLLPWSLEWITRRSPLVGRAGWLVPIPEGALERASLGAGWPLLGWIAFAVAAAIVVGRTRVTFALGALGVLALLAGATGAFQRETTLAAVGISALGIVAVVARAIGDQLSTYELGRRHVAVVAGLATLGALWLGGVVQNIPPGARAGSLPVLAAEAEQGRVLWLAPTTGGLRSWSTLGFTEQLRAFPAPAGPTEHLAARAVEAAQQGRTHRLGGILALADISHVVALDAPARRGLEGQADLAPQEIQAGALVYRNDAWRGPAMLLAAPPTRPLSAGGLADVVRDPRAVSISGWPSGEISLRLAEEEEVAEEDVLYVAGGRRGGLRVDGTRGTLAAAGAYFPATNVAEAASVTAPARWWRWMLPLELALIALLLVAWFAAAYIGGPAPPSSEVLPDLRPVVMDRKVLAVLPAAIVLAIVVGWSGVSWGLGGPFLSSAWYCPPIGQGFRQSIGIVNPGREEVQFIVRPHLAAPPVAEDRIEGLTRASIDISAQRGAVVESYGRRLGVATQVSRMGDRDASLCAQFTRELNVFPEGGRFATRAQPRLFERYVIYNPFPDLARAAVRFVSPDETIVPPALQDVRVEPGSFVVVDPEEQFEPMPNLSTTVRVWQGRAIVARRLRTEEQVSWSLAPEPRDGGVLPRAQTEEATSVIVAVNPSEEVARVSVTGSVAGGPIPRESFAVPAAGRSSFELNAIAPRAAEIVAEISSDRAVVFETLVAPDDRRAVSLFPPLAPARSWVFPMAEERELVLVNPNPRAVRVSIERLGPGERVRDVTVEASATATVALPGDEPFGLVVRSPTGGVTAAVVGPTGSMPGVPGL